MCVRNKRLIPAFDGSLAVNSGADMKIRQFRKVVGGLVIRVAHGGQTTLVVGWLGAVSVFRNVKVHGGKLEF